MCERWLADQFIMQGRHPAPVNRFGFVAKQSVNMEARINERSIVNAA